MHSQTAPYVPINPCFFHPSYLSLLSRTRGRSGSPPTYIFVSEDSDLKNSQSSSECNYQSSVFSYHL